MNIKSLRDAGYQQAKINSTLEDVARYAMASIPTLGNPNLSRGDQFTKEQRDQLSEGYMLHYGEAVKPERLFAIVDGNYVEKSAKEIEKLNVEKFALNVNVAFAVTQQMLNEMKTSDQVRYQLIQGLRTDTNTYVSNRLGDLITKAKKIWRERAGLKAERVQALAFAEFEKKAMDTMLERVRNADARGNDPSANVELTKRRIAAYWSVK